MLNLRHVEAFLALAEELNFTRAAARLHLTQPALTHQIQQLELAVGTDLVDRRKRQIELTPAGTAFLPEARRLLEAADRAVAAARNAVEPERPVRVAYSSSVGWLLFPELLDRLESMRDRLSVVWI